MRNILIISPYSLGQGLASGGQQRLYQLCYGLSKNNNILLLDIIHPNSRRYTENDKFQELSIPLSRIILGFRELNRRFFKFKNILFIFISIASLFNVKFKRSLKKYTTWADIIIIEHPYLVFNLNKSKVKRLLIYDAHNVEYDYQKSIMPTSFLKKSLLSYMKFIESKSCQLSNLIFAVSERDKVRLHNLYRVPLEKILVVPHGVDINEINLATDEDRCTAKKRYSLGGKNTALFVGSEHKPNLEAVEFIVFKLVPQLKDINFLIVGDIENKFKEKYERKFWALENVKFFGIISNSQKAEIMKASDIALNPIFSGAGTNVKMTEYMAAGVPVITTPFGARGLELEHRKHAMICKPEDFKENIEELYKDKELYGSIRMNARKLIERKYGWEKIISNIFENLRKNQKDFNANDPANILE